MGSALFHLIFLPNAMRPFVSCCFFSSVCGLLNEWHNKDVELLREVLQGGRGSTIVMYKNSTACTSAVSEVGKKLK